MSHSAPIADNVQDLWLEKESEFDDNQGMMTFFTRR